MEKQRDLDRLLSDLQSFLLVLDGENLTLVAKAKKESIADLLMQLQNPLAEDAEYMTMNCISTSGGHRNQRETGPRSARKGGNLSNSGEKETFQGIPAPRSRHPLHLPPPEVPRAKKVLPSHLQRQTGDDCYEEAEPLSPRGHSNTGSADTDSSHYESYGEEEDCVKDRAHYIQWSPGASISDGPARPESQICGFLWRKKWLGQWAKQLFIIREHLLLCYKCARDLQPLLQLDLRGCRVAYKPKHSKKMQHELKISSSSETLVMGFQSRQQAEEWRKVIEEVSSSTLWGSPPTPGMDRSKHSPQVKSAARCSELDQGHGQLQPPAAPRKPGPLNVLLNCRWQSFWCSVERDVLRMFRDSGCADTPEHSVPLRGCHVTTSTGPNMGQRYGIGIAKHGKDIAVLETCSEDERDVWLKLLQAGSDRDHESEAVSVYEGTNGETSSSGDATSPASVGALLLRKFPTPNAYMDDPFGQIPAPASPDPVYFNADIPQFVSFNGVGQQGSPRRPSGLCPGSPQELQMSNTTIPASEICNAPKSNLAKSRSDYQMQSRSPPLREKAFFGSHQTLVPSETQGAADGMVLPIGKRSFPRPQEKAAEPERACRMRTQLKAGSEMNLLAIGRSSAQASCDYVAMNVHSAGSEGAYPVPVPVLKRASSAKGTLKRAPSVVVIEKGRVLQKRKEWEMKASA